VCRRNLVDFVKTMWPVVEPTTPFQPGYHVDAICDHLAAIRDIRNLLIAMPPRFGKSTLLAVLWFAWYWCTYPETRFIFSSYSLQLSTRDSVRARNLIESKLYQSFYGGVYNLSGDVNTKTLFENNKGGRRLAVSTSGSTLGEGGEIIAVDDPLNVQEAESKAARDEVIRWFTTVFSTRLNDPATGCRVVVGQRCHVDDLAGYLLKNDDEGAWTRLILPLEAGKCKWVSTRWQDKRAPGELLSPARLPPKEVSFLRKQLGRRSFESQYNQNPAPAEDSLFNTDDIQWYKDLPPGGCRIAAVDLAISLKGDYTVIAIADVHNDGTVFLVHLHRERMPGTRIVPTLKQLYTVYRPSVIYCEDVAFQRMVIQECRAQGMPVKAIRPEGDKISRSIMLQVLCENHKFFLPEDKAWTADVVEELAEFPGAPHDDVTDCLSYLALQANLLYRRLPERTQEETPEVRNQRVTEEFRKAVAEDERRLKASFFAGL
jgi:predicted phage terminase large subunit-like protein